MKGDANQILLNIRRQAGNVTDQIKRFNSQLRERVQQQVQVRKQEVMEQMNALASLGVPIRKRDDVPATFSIPVSRKKLVTKPSAPSGDFSPEPSLDDENYNAILKMTYDYGIEMERHPNIYAKKDEEALRDHFIMMLSPHFESATGETFNKSGKTDILIRHEGKNVFVAECKFWKGAKGVHQTVDQLLSYLTWRDSKTAIVWFVQNRELNPILEKVLAETRSHPCFVKDFGKKQDGWYDYEFHLKEDSSRGVKLAVLCFHFPKT